MTAPRERSIRSSQSIHPYGPGAILDWGQECFVVMDTSATNPGWRNAERIELKRLQRRLSAPAGFRKPPVALSKPGILVQRFPSWLFCPVCRTMTRWGRDEERQNRGSVPRCTRGSCARRRPVLVPMRYIAACRDGHLCDIDWFRWAHRSHDAQCDPRSAHLIFSSRSGRGASLGAISIDCRSCRASGTIEGLLGKNGLARIGQSCPGRQPWQSRDDARQCEQPLQALQRSQTAVHFSQLESALDITEPEQEPDPRFSSLLNTLRDVRAELSLDVGHLRMLSEKLAIRATKDLQTAYPSAEPVGEAEILEAIGRVEADDQHEGADEAPAADDLMSSEWDVLSKDTGRGTDGANPGPISVRSEPLDDSSPLSRLLDGVFLVDRLREVRAFVGFRRVSPEGELVHPNLGRQRPNWLPAVEVFGEGIFLRFAEGELRTWERQEEGDLAVRLRDMRARLHDPDEFARRFTERLDVLPRFILVHTFAHLLIRELCYECGYSSASLRERLYVFPDRAGVLIYTADGDSEGSLGGLVRQGAKERLANIVLAALSRASWCSNDPVCRELSGRGPAKTNLAACHACSLVSETSCTELNGLLDRAVLVGTAGEAPVRGYFRDLMD